MASKARAGEVEPASGGRRDHPCCLHQPVPLLSPVSKVVYWDNRIKGIHLRWTGLERFQWLKENSRLSTSDAGLPSLAAFIDDSSSLVSLLNTPWEQNYVLPRLSCRILSPSSPQLQGTSSQRRSKSRRSRAGLVAGSTADHLSVCQFRRYDVHLAELTVTEGRICATQTPVSVISRQFFEASWRPGMHGDPRARGFGPRCRELSAHFARSLRGFRAVVNQVQGKMDGSSGTFGVPPTWKHLSLKRPGQSCNLGYSSC